jgi:hypothetical protein
MSFIAQHWQLVGTAVVMLIGAAILWASIIDEHK